MGFRIWYLMWFSVFPIWKSGFSSIWAAVLRKVSCFFITANESVHVTLRKGNCIKYHETSVWVVARERFRKKSAKLPLNLQLFSLRYEFSLLSTYQHGQTLVDLLVSQRNLIFKPDLHDSVMNKWIMRKGNCIQFSKFQDPMNYRMT